MRTNPIPDLVPPTFISVNEMEAQMTTTARASIAPESLKTFNISKHNKLSLGVLSLTNS